MKVGEAQVCIGSWQHRNVLFESFPKVLSDLKEPSGGGVSFSIFRPLGNKDFSSHVLRKGG